MQARPGVRRRERRLSGRKQHASAGLLTILASRALQGKDRRGAFRLLLCSRASGAGSRCGRHSATQAPQSAGRRQAVVQGSLPKYLGTKIGLKKRKTSREREYARPNNCALFRSPWRQGNTWGGGPKSAGSQGELALPAGPTDRPGAPLHCPGLLRLLTSLPEDVQGRGKRCAGLVIWEPCRSASWQTSWRGAPGRAGSLGGMGSKPMPQAPNTLPRQPIFYPLTIGVPAH